MKLLVIGSGGREHALAWKCAQSDRVEQVFVAPGNAGTATEAGVQNIAIAADSIDELLEFAQQEKIGLTIVGPEQPLVEGIVDRFQAAGLKIFGPSAAAAKLEGSKAFAKDFMARHEIPTASYATFNDLNGALAYLNHHPLPVVIKADGLAAGKGVIVAQELAQAEAAVRDMLAGNKFGEAGHRVVIEEFLVGEEASFIVISDGQRVVPLATSQDHKALEEGDTGPNTGGMGAYSPAPVVTDSVAQQAMDEIILPTIEGLANDGHPFVGFLYAGLMVTSDGAKTLEFNVRLGDPETQPIMMRLTSDLVELCIAATDQALASVSTSWDTRACLGVVMAAGGYPHDYPKGRVVSGLDQVQQAKVFHAGTLQQNSSVVTAGGRVLCVCALGETLAEAQGDAYAAVERVRWDGAYYRRDIGQKAL